MSTNEQQQKQRISTQQKKRVFLEALERNLGVITPAMKEAGIKSRTTIMQWRNTDPDFQRQTEEIESTAGDFVENALLKKIKDGDTTAIIFYCKTKLKKRGYIERLDVANVKPIEDEETIEVVEKKLAALKKLQQTDSE